MAEFYEQNTEFNPKKIAPILFIVVGIIVLLIGWNRIAISIKSGNAGVLYNYFSGTQTDQWYGEGLHFIAPWNSMIIYEVRQQEMTEKMAVLSSNGLEINVELSAWYQPILEVLPSLHQEKGPDYLNRVVRPSMRSATRSVIGRYTPDELYSSKRDAIQSEIFEETKKILDDEYIQLNEVLVRDITLPPTIKSAIETKLQQEQAALEYKFKLLKAQKEAERIKIEAQGKADAFDIINKSLTDKILTEKGIEATLELAKSPNSKVVVVGGGKNGLPLILNSDK